MSGAKQKPVKCLKINLIKVHRAFLTQKEFRLNHAAYILFSPAGLNRPKMVKC